jgi:hypothetical protein
LSQFRIRTASFEVRYPNAFLLWDNAGRVWTAVSEVYPDATLDESSPNKIAVSIGEKYHTSVNIDRSSFVVSIPKSGLSELIEVASFICPILISRLELSVFTRIGLRVIYEKRFETREAAAAFVSEHLPFAAPTGKYLNVNSVLVEPDLAIRVEDEVQGYLVRFQSKRVSLSLPLPVEFRDLAPSKIDRTFATFDVDYYAHGTTNVAAFNARGLIESWFQVIKRDALKVLHV